MPYKPKLPNPADVIKIVVIELPEAREFGEGLYDLRRGSEPKKPNYYDILGLLKVLSKELPGMEEGIVDRLQNFRKAYINIRTKEVTS